MQILAFNGSPRKKGNTSTIVSAVLEGAQSAGAETTEVRLHDINMKGCQGCLSCRTNPGVCAQKDELSPFLAAMATCDGIVLASPIYMYRMAGQIKLFVDRCYSYYATREDGKGYDSVLAPGKRFAVVTSQGAESDEQYSRSVRWLAGMAGTGFGMEEVGRIIHTSSAKVPAKDDHDLLEKARSIGRRLAGGE